MAATCTCTLLPSPLAPPSRSPFSSSSLSATSFLKAVRPEAICSSPSTAGAADPSFPSFTSFPSLLFSLSLGGLGALNASACSAWMAMALCN